MVAVIGAYSDRVVTGENAAGYTIELWQDEAQAFGFFRGAAGLAEDTPTGLLENVRYDAKDKTLSFKAKLSMGLATIDGQNWVPTRDIYQFEGTLYPDQITGHLIHLNALEPKQPARHQKVTMYRLKDEAAAMARPATYKEWLEMADRVLQARGPKW